jgi:hypothetical protein
MGCCRFQRHRVRCMNETGGGSWSDGSLRESLSEKFEPVAYGKTFLLEQNGVALRRQILTTQGILLFAMRLLR